MSEIKSYKNLVVWKKSIGLVKEVYKLIKLLPNEEKYALADQMRRSVISVPSNIAEGQARSGHNDFVHFLTISLGSLYELETQLIMCGELGYFSREQLDGVFSLINEISRMLNTLIKKLKTCNLKQIETHN